MPTPIVIARLILGVGWMVVCTPPLLVALLLALPWRALRVRIGGPFGHAIGRFWLELSGSHIVVQGTEHLDASRPAIYVANHTSTFDILLGIWLSPYNTCGVAKRQILLYPIFGQLWWLSGHLHIDRDSPMRAVASLKELATFMRQNRLGAFIWPEGKRSPDGRLKQFKKGAFQLAIATGLPVVPIAIEGSQGAWQSRSLRVMRTRLRVTCLPPVDTSSWRTETLSAHVRDIEDRIAAALPPEQRPLTERPARGPT
jgi:1-acyl-sn-glycerol-3-phosphate acyltransferase